MLHDPARHEPLQDLPWDAEQARAFIQHIVDDAEARCHEDRYWPAHPLDLDGRQLTATSLETPLYDGACGVLWTLHHLQAVGAARLSRSGVPAFARLLACNRAELGVAAERERASFLFGDTPILLMAFGAKPSDELADTLAALIEGNLAHPARELMWGSPGTLLTALFLHERTGDERWAALYRRTAAQLWSELQWSEEHRCFYWTQDLYGRRSTYLDAVHGFVATALPLIRGRHLLAPADWQAWQQTLVDTVHRTVDREGEPGIEQANWRPQLEGRSNTQKQLVQFCHGAPGFVVCLAGMPGHTLDEVLLAAGRTIWAAGPLVKGSNLCHGTGGNGYAFLKLYQRTQDPQWLARARAFAMHGIAQTRAQAREHGQGRYSLWTGDVGFAVYLWDCLRAQARFPTLDVFWSPHDHLGA